MGILNRITRFSKTTRIIEPNATSAVDLEWTRGQFSKMVVGESNYVSGFAHAYGMHVWEGKSRKPTREVRDMVVVELHREPANAYDSNAIAVWCAGSSRVQNVWQAGYLARDSAEAVAPVVDAAGISEWSCPAELHGTVSTSNSMFGVFLMPSRLVSRGPDLSGISRKLNLGFGPATPKQVAFILSLLGAGPSSSGLVDGHSEAELQRLLRLVGNPRKWRRPEDWAHLDQHQASIAIDVLQGRALWSQ